MAGENDLTSQFQKAFQSMTATQKVMVGAILAIAIMAMAGLGIWAGQKRMATLATNLAPTDANAIVEQLKKQNIPYDLSSDQRTVLVPDNRVGELRLAMAGQGLLTGDKLGFEKLETPGLTT